VSPKLLSVNNTSISVPGIYKSDSELITISGFGPTLEVLKSKQLPWKISIFGNEKEYIFLLKGWEDIWQDERAM